MFYFICDWHPRADNKPYLETSIWTLIKTDTYHVSYHMAKLPINGVFTENSPIMFFIHLDLLPKMSKKEWNDMMDDWNFNRRHLPPIIFTMATKDSPGLNKFREKHLGCKYIRDMHCEDGVTRRIYVHVIDEALMDSPLVQFVKHGQLW